MIFPSCGRKLELPLEFRQGLQGISPASSGKSGLLSSCKVFLRIPL